MISQVLAIISMALGVASGTKATSNTFYDITNKKPINKAVENYETELEYTKASEWHSNNYQEEYVKYYLDDDTTDTPVSNTYVLDNMLIYNSTYVFEQPWSNNPNYYSTQVRAVYKIINVYNGATQFNPQLYVITENTNVGTYGIEIATSTDESLDQAIDMTMTQNAYNNFLNIVNPAVKTGIDQEQGQTEAQTTKTFNIQVPTITLLSKETKYLLITFYLLTTPPSSTTDTVLTGLNITANYIVPETTQEIVDIPGLMFTVISLPFSFISTAFNLTIFPNTPYAVNFSNLFMVILAAFILMWLIKKVFH